MFCPIRLNHSVHLYISHCSMFNCYSARDSVMRDLDAPAVALGRSKRYAQAKRQTPRNIISSAQRPVHLFQRWSCSTHLDKVCRTHKMTTHSAQVFTSIFPTLTATHTTPTPQATPDVGFTAPGQPFGGPNLGSVLTSPRAGQTRQSIRNARQAQNQQQQQLSAAQRQVKRNFAWSAATQFLSLQGVKEPLRRHVEERRSRDVEDALVLLLVGEDGDASDGRRELLDWYLEEVKQHFKGTVRLSLPRTLGEDRSRNQNWAWDWFKDLVPKVERAKDIYYAPLQHHILPIVRSSDSDTAEELGRTARGTISSILMGGIDPNLYRAALEHISFATGWTVLPLHQANLDIDSNHSMTKLSRLLRKLDDLGFPAEDIERSLAAATNSLVEELIQSEYLKVDWFTHQSVVSKLRACIYQLLGDFVMQVLSRNIVEGSNLEPVLQTTITKEERQAWVDTAVARLGRLRLHGLFDYVIRWDDSRGAIKDIKEFIPMAGARADVVQSFQQQLHRRLLHAGASTVQILDTYVHTIKAFTELDPKGVLLDRVARPIRRYLKDRDDTTRIIIASLLADVNDASSDDDIGEDVSIQIARQMQDAVTEMSQEYDVDLDWNNMEWTPDPHDAGPDYRRSKTEDIISSLLSLYDREDFINELKNILGEHLLKARDSELEKEIRLLEIFKTRLGEDKLQAAEVMLHDIEESRHINASVQADANYKISHLRSRNEESDEDEGAMVVIPGIATEAINLSAQILSSFFWPPLRDDAFKVPIPVARQQEGYDSSFRALKDMRRLKWLHELGNATVELELADRNVEIECATYQASIIYAFHDVTEGSEVSQQAQRTVEELAELLEMEESLVRQALAFWVSKLVLTESSPGSDTYSVLERLPTSMDAAKEAEAAAAAAAEAAQAATVKNPEDVLLENMQIYRQFIQGMLTNQGKMEVARMHMMLKMVVPGGFAFSTDELRTLLQRMGVEGLVSAEGDAWSVIK